MFLCFLKTVRKTLLPDVKFLLFFLLFLHEVYRL